MFFILKFTEMQQLAMFKIHLESSQRDSQNNPEVLLLGTPEQLFKTHRQGVPNCPHMEPQKSPKDPT